MAANLAILLFNFLGTEDQFLDLGQALIGDHGRLDSSGCSGFIRVCPNEVGG